MKKLLGLTRKFVYSLMTVISCLSVFSLTALASEDPGILLSDGRVGEPSIKSFLETSPATGDTTSIVPWIIVIIVAVAAVAIVIIRKRKK